jgi:hypothetical protein
MCRTPSFEVVPQKKHKKTGPIWQLTEFILVEKAVRILDLTL